MSNIEKVQIVGGGNLENAFSEYGISAVKVVHTFHEFGPQYGLQVWELSKEDFERFDKLTSEAKYWDSQKLGWFRQGGVNVSHNDLITLNVKGQEMLTFKNRSNYYHSEEFLNECKEDGEEPYLPSYHDLFEHLELYWGASKVENVALFINALSKINGVSKAEFVEKYTDVINS